MKKIIMVLLFILTGIGCKEPFTADLLFDATNFLVVEGYINVGPGPTTITLSRTSTLDSEEPMKMEINATVRVEEQDNTMHLIEQSGDGIYSASLNLSADRPYRLNITTTDGKKFVSEFTEAINTPEIDSIFWTSSEQGVSIQLATHDPLNKTLYYQWDYTETWEIVSAYFAYLKHDKGNLVPVDADDRGAMRTCWKTSTPRDMILYSTARFTEDKVPHYQLVRIPQSSERLSERYSILVRQHALDKAAFDYLQLMKKNTGPLGTFSDPQPSELIGNIICLDSNEPVVGYVGAYTTSERRIFIDKSEIPDWDYMLSCPRVHNINHPDTLIKYFVNALYRPIEATKIDPDTGIVLEYDFSYDFCLDCRTRDGVSTKPDFW